MVTVAEIRKRKGLPEQIPAPAVKTPEEIAQAQAEGNAYIQAREQLASRLGGTASGQKEASKILSASETEVQKQSRIKQINLETEQKKVLAEQQLVERQNYESGKLQQQQLAEQNKTATMLPLELKGGVETASELFNIVKTAFTSKKPLKYENAKEVLKSSVSIVERDIENIKTGGSATDARRNLNNAYTALNTAERSAKGLGKLNLNWLIDSGISIQAEILNERALLNSMALKINEAERMSIMSAIEAEKQKTLSQEELQ